MQFYTEIFPDSSIGLISRYQAGEASSPEAKINYAAFQLSGLDFSAMDNGYNVDYSFNEAFSFIVSCRNQEEIDYYWDKLSAVPEAEQCGWLKDQFGVSWQIVPECMKEMMRDGDAQQINRVTQAFLLMKKIRHNRLAESI